MSQMLTSSSENSENMLRDVQQRLRTQSTVAQADTSARTQESERASQDLTRIIGNTEMILQGIQNLSLRTLNNTRPGSGVYGSSAVETRHTEPAGIHLRSVHGSDTRLDSLYHSIAHDISTKPPMGNSGRCTCRTVFKARYWHPFSIFRFSRTSRTQHYSFCPEYAMSEQSFELTTHLVPPPWLLSYTISLGFQVNNWHTMKPFSICPIVVGTNRLVDRQNSPAFRALQTAQGKWGREMAHLISIETFHSTLEELFDQQEASALDVDRGGRSLLYVSIPKTISIHDRLTLPRRSLIGTAVYNILLLSSWATHICSWSNSCWTRELIQICSASTVKEPYLISVHGNYTLMASFSPRGLSNRANQRY
jgi:hypothetical protein